MTMLAYQITSLTVVYSIVYSGVNQRKHQSSASLAFVWEIHRGPVNFPHKWPVTRKLLPFDDVIMQTDKTTWHLGHKYMCVYIHIYIYIIIYIHICSWYVHRTRPGVMWSHRIMFTILRLSGPIWQPKSLSTLARVMACCLTTHSHYLK